MLAALDVETIQVRTPADLDRADALVMPGGESSTMSMMLARSGLLDPLRSRLAEGMAPDRRANVRVRVTLPDGQLATGEVRLQGLRSSH